ncbi:hypothetical protein FC56_GL001507 [Lentilactobacillus senioris DSM 24302 = JCM 17472]|uniref:Uncharacterized protein n=1 Tax=Lentilactobacillus senioris DSM 24302 = JCM 17472 TaxID=1423802 RepID=A0A0R2CT49_9LACO|nr:hypothetical protein FC56_GL001507 [Lentilactobacillus senioris DSM 24302 = JCM 17472]
MTDVSGNQSGWLTRVLIREKWCWDSGEAGWRSDERQILIESRPISRLRIYSSYLLTGVLTSSITLFMMTFGLFIGQNSSLSDPFSWSAISRIFIGYWPLMLFIFGLLSVLTGWIPKATIIIYPVIIFDFIILMFGKLLQLDDWIMNLVSFHWG